MNWHQNLVFPLILISICCFHDSGVFGVDEVLTSKPVNTTEGSNLELLAEIGKKCTGRYIRIRTFGVIVNDVTRELCITKALNDKKIREFGPLCANVAERIEMDFRAGRIRINDSRTSDSGRYYLDTVDDIFCKSRTIFDIAVRPHVADKPDKPTNGIRTTAVVTGKLDKYKYRPTNGTSVINSGAVTTKGSFKKMILPLGILVLLTV